MQLISTARITSCLPTIRSESARSRSGTQSLGVKLHLRPPAIDLALWQTYHFRWWLLAPNSWAKPSRITTSLKSWEGAGWE